MVVSLSVSPSIVQIGVAGWRSLSLSLSLSLFPSIVKVRVAGWWSFSLSPSIVNVRPLSVSFYRQGEGCWVVGGWVVVSPCFLLYSGKGGWVVVSLSLSFSLSLSLLLSLR